MAKVFDNNRSTNNTINAIDRKREQERKYMLSLLFKNAEELATKLVQKLLDNHIIETTSDRAMRELFVDLFRSLADIEEFDLQFKIAPIRNITNDPNHISLYLTQYIIEDLINHPKVDDVFGSDLEIYQTVELVMSILRSH